MRVPHPSPPLAVVGFLISKMQVTQTVEISCQAPFSPQFPPIT
jgi:hypothetical protein